MYIFTGPMPFYEYRPNLLIYFEEMLYALYPQNSICHVKVYELPPLLFYLQLNKKEAIAFLGRFNGKFIIHPC